MRISESLPGGDLGKLASGGRQTLELRAGPLSIPFECTFAMEEAGRVRGLGIAPGAAFTVDLELRPSGDAVTVEGKVLVSGTLAGLGQRELQLQVRRLLARELARD